MLDSEPALHPARLDVRAVGYRAGLHRLLTDVSFTALPGEFVGVLGPSGAGKSTLLNLICGRLQPSKGRVLVSGRTPRELGEARARWIGHVPQDDIVHPTLRVQRALYYAAQLRLPPKTRPEAVTRRVHGVLALLSLSDRARARIHSLSGGERKRVNVAVELLCRPPLVLLDEPTTGLDPALEEQLMATLRRIAQSGHTVLATTHVTLNADLFDLVLILAGGTSVYYGPPERAPRFFGVGSLPEVYRELSRDRPGQWHKKFRHSELFQQYVADRWDERDQPAPRVAEAGQSRKAVPEPTAEEIETELEQLRARVRAKKGGEPQ